MNILKDIVKQNKIELTHLNHLFYFAQLANSNLL